MYVHVPKISNPNDILHAQSPLQSVSALIRVGYCPVGITTDTLTARRPHVMVRLWQVGVCARLNVKNGTMQEGSILGHVSRIQRESSNSVAATSGG